MTTEQETEGQKRAEDAAQPSADFERAARIVRENSAYSLGRMLVELVFWIISALILVGAAFVSPDGASPEVILFIWAIAIGLVAELAVLRFVIIAVFDIADCQLLARM